MWEISFSLLYLTLLTSCIIGRFLCCHQLYLIIYLIWIKTIKRLLCFTVKMTCELCDWRERMQYANILLFSFKQRQYNPHFCSKHRSKGVSFVGRAGGNSKLLLYTCSTVVDLHREPKVFAIFSLQFWKTWNLWRKIMCDLFNVEIKIETLEWSKTMPKV